jgi:LPS-assembly lipoprotein
MSRGASLQAFAIPLAALALAGCGFTPMYGTPGLSANLSSVQVVAPDGRVAYLVREDLDDAFGKNKDAAPRWRLDFTVVQVRDPRGLNLNNITERYQTDITVNYVLTNTANGAVAHRGEVTSAVSYDDANDPYAGIAAREDTQRRAASDAARRIETELAAWMASHARD